MWQDVWRRNVDVPLNSLDLATMGKRKQPESHEPTRTSKRKRTEAPQQEEQPARTKGRAQQHDNEYEASDEGAEPDFYEMYGFPPPGSIASYREEDQAKLEREATWEMEMLLNLAGILRDPIDPCVLFDSGSSSHSSYPRDPQPKKAPPKGKGKGKGKHQPEGPEWLAGWEFYRENHVRRGMTKFIQPQLDYIHKMKESWRPRAGRKLEMPEHWFVCCFLACCCSVY